MNNKVNLCDSCKYIYPDCPSRKNDVIFGNGIGNDNICACAKYVPSAQPEPCEDDPRADVYHLAEKIGIHRLYALVVELRGEPEPCEDAVSRKAAIDALDCINGVEEVLKALPSAQQKPLKYSGDSICVYCMTGNCAGCVYEPMEGR